jgi:lysine-specific demethylase 3
LPDAPLDLGKKRPGSQPADSEATSSKLPKIEADLLLASDSVGSASDLSRSSNDPAPSSNSQTSYVHNKKAWLKSYVSEPPKPPKTESSHDDASKATIEPASVSPVSPAPKLEAPVKTEVNGNGAATVQSSEEGKSNSPDKVGKRKKDAVARKSPQRPAGTRTSSRTKEIKRYQDYGENGSSGSDDSDDLVAFTPNRVGAGKRRGRKPKSNGDGGKESSASSRRNSSASRSRSGSRNTSRTNSPAPSRSGSQKAKKVTPGRKLSLKRSGEPFLQMGTCFEIAPKLPKCRECRWAHRQRNKKMLNKFCRFYAFRRLK